MTTAPAIGRFSHTLHRERLDRAVAEAADRGLDALLVSPSVDYAYLLGYSPTLRERLTCLILPVHGDPTLVLPRLEGQLARDQLGPMAEQIALLEWRDGEDASKIVRAILPPETRRVGVQDQMPAAFLLRLQAILDPIELVAAGPSLAALRQRKSPEEIDRLRAAAEAADEAMVAIMGERFIGRSEAELSRRIEEELLDAGHDRADFAIVATGPNSASPHHAPGERLVGRGDAIVLDIGGTLDGYCSDTTRTAFVGESPSDFAALYAVVQRAQEAACAAARPGVTGRELDALATQIIAEAGYGEQILHRTGHGIGMETHEEPYIFEGNDAPLEAGQVFSIEPGIYEAGRWGARIEDIVVLTKDGAERLNQTSRDLFLVE
jgi:Xaa-Pro aminopeptidase